METSKAELLDDAVAAVNRLILLAQDCGLPDSAQFLAMAKTQLLIDRNGITDGEFRALVRRDGDLAEVTLRGRFSGIAVGACADTAG